ncbi:hypothetical protein [Marinobacter salexigens]|uniref:hypothetical protein n=1 Tax=Marinobacter salexigens TaxID=1925763 RepID=UPI0012905D2F|nr:hypothetical protein [Marinobacter salexigens]
MDIEWTVEDVSTFMAEALRGDLAEGVNGEELLFRWSGREVQLPIDSERVQASLDLLRSMETVGETALVAPRCYEMLVREEGRLGGSLVRRANIDIYDPDSGIRYVLSKPTNEYILFLLHSASDLGSVRVLVRPTPGSLRIDGSFDEPPVDAFEGLRRVLRGFLTLQVFSDRDRPKAELERFSQAFLFNISFNLDTALVPQRHIEELLRPGRIARLRRGRVVELEPPRRHYIADLLYHYQLAVGTDNPLLEFVSYYHVAEHFFEEIFSDELIANVRDRLTSPDFSYKRKKDISGLIKQVSRAVQLRNESIVFSEIEALRLTLKKHVKLDGLIASLKEYDDTLVEYYKTNKVIFSGGEPVNIEGEEEDLIYKHLSSRIYKTRNSVVHSKESDRSKYMPYRDDRHLVKEVPLLRFIAEQIILSTSTEIP